MALNPVAYPFNFTLTEQITAIDLVGNLMSIARVLLELTGESAPQQLASALNAAQVGDGHRAIAQRLSSAKRGTILLGSGALGHPAAAELRAIAALVASLSGCRLGTLAAGNSAGAWLAGAVPHRGPGGRIAEVAGMDWRAMFAAGLKGYLLLGTEPEYDCIDSAAALAAMQQAEFVVALSAYAGEAMRGYADVILPIATFAETAGTLVNAAGQWQSFHGAAPAPGEARPAWKVLRVMGNLLDLPGFEFVAADEVRAEFEDACREPVQCGAVWQPGKISPPAAGLVRIADIPIYAVDAMVRRAAPLQASADADLWQLRLNAATAERLGLGAKAEARLRQGDGEVVLPLLLDETVADDAVCLPAGLSVSVGLGGGYAPVELTPV